MSDNQDQIDITSQLSAIQKQLGKLTDRFDKLEHNLGEVSGYRTKISQLEDDLMLLGDRYRYQDLQKYLKDENWFEADKETIRLILAVTAKEIEELTPEDIQHFPCNDLMVIDRLWMKYSDGRFGFSPQLKVYLAKGGSFDTTVEQNQQLIQAWGEDLGWRKDNRWLPCNELDFSLDAPIGCHPSRWWNSPYGSKMTNFFLGRLITCDINSQQSTVNSQQSTFRLIHRYLLEVGNKRRLIINSKKNNFICPPYIFHPSYWQNMAKKPIILTIDDDLEVLQSIARDLRKQYGDRFRIVRANSGASAIETLEQLKLRNETVALFLTDQRMPGMDGVTFIEQAAPMFPKAKRVLLTAYADTNAAIEAINTAKLDYYLLKPWDPPEEKLYPVLDDLLQDWLAVYRPAFEGIRVVGDRWSPCSHNVKDFLARNQIPYRWLDVETEPEATKLVEYVANGSKPKLPLVLFPDGNRLEQPTNLEVAEQIGLQTQAVKPFYDLVIVGGGPAGLAAAVYGASEGLSTVMIERSAPGGQAGSSSRIENYLGFPVGLSGDDLARRGVTQAKRFGVEILTPQEVVEVKIEEPYRIVKLADGGEINCHALLLSTGVYWRRLNLPGCDRLTGRGVYYGAAKTEAMSCQDEEIYVVGGANSAGQAAMYFAKYAAKVNMLVRGDSLTKSMSQYLIDQIDATENIEVLTHTEVKEVHGENSLTGLTLLYNQTGETEKVDTNYLFIFIGAKPETEWLESTVARDERGFIYAGADLKGSEHFRGWNRDRDPFLLETSVPGIFVAGDVRHNSVKRVASGVGEGSIAIMFVHRYLAEVGA